MLASGAMCPARSCPAVPRGCPGSPYSLHIGARQQAAATCRFLPGNAGDATLCPMPRGCSRGEGSRLARSRFPGARRQKGPCRSCLSSPDPATSNTPRLPGSLCHHPYGSGAARACRCSRALDCLIDSPGVWNIKKDQRTTTIRCSEPVHSGVGIVASKPAQ